MIKKADAATAAMAAAATAVAVTAEVSSQTLAASIPRPDALATHEQRHSLPLALALYTPNASLLLAP